VEKSFKTLKIRYDPAMVNGKFCTERNNLARGYETVGEAEQLGGERLDFAENSFAHTRM